MKFFLAYYKELNQNYFFLKNNEAKIHINIKILIIILNF